jgi:hypothetical protein
MSLKYYLKQLGLDLSGPLRQAESNRRWVFPTPRPVASAEGETDCRRIFGLSRWSVAAPGHDEIRAGGSQSE